MYRKIIVNSIHFEDPDIRAGMGSYFIVFCDQCVDSSLLDFQDRVSLPLKNGKFTVGVVETIEPAPDDEIFILGFSCAKDAHIDLKKGDVLTPIEE